MDNTKYDLEGRNFIAEAIKKYQPWTISYPTDNVINNMMKLIATEVYNDICIEKYRSFGKQVTDRNKTIKKQKEDIEKTNNKISSLKTKVSKLEKSEEKLLLIIENNEKEITELSKTKKLR